MSGNTRTTPSCVSPTCRGRRRPREIDLSPWKGRVPLEMLGRTAFPRIGDEPYLVTLAPYGFFWFLLCDQPEPKDAHAVPREFTTLVWTDGSNSLIRNRERHALEHDVLPHFLLERRWFAEKARGLPTPKLQSIIPLERDGNPAFVIIGVPGERQTVSRYLLPLMRQMDPPRSGRAAIGERRRRDPPRLARRHPDRCRRRSGFHRDPAAGHACRRLDRSGATGGWSALPTTAFGQMPAPKVEKIVRAEPRAVQHHRDRGCELRREDLPQAQRRHSSRDRDRALPDRAYRLPERARSAGLDRTGRRRTAKRARRRASVRREPGRRLDGHRRLSRPLHRRPARAVGGGHARGKPGACVLSAAAAADRTPDRRVAERAGEPARHCGVRAGAGRRRGHRGLDRTAGRAQRPHVRSPGRKARAISPKPTRPWPIACWQSRAAITDHIRALAAANHQAR